jgi:hypothetical protein
MTTLPSHASPSIRSNRIDRQPPTDLDTAKPAVVLPPPSGISIGPIIIRTFIVALVIAGGIVLAVFLGLFLGFIPIAC